jgi:hypothetical protein
VGRHHARVYVVSAQPSRAFKPYSSRVYNVNAISSKGSIRMHDPVFPVMNPHKDQPQSTVQPPQVAFFSRQVLNKFEAATDLIYNSSASRMKRAPLKLA